MRNSLRRVHYKLCQPPRAWAGLKHRKRAGQKFNMNLPWIKWGFPWNCYPCVHSLAQRVDRAVGGEKNYLYPRVEITPGPSASRGSIFGYHKVILVNSNPYTLRRTITNKILLYLMLSTFYWGDIIIIYYVLRHH